MKVTVDLELRNEDGLPTGEIEHELYYTVGSRIYLDEDLRRMVEIAAWVSFIDHLADLQREPLDGAYTSAWERGDGPNNEWVRVLRCHSLDARSGARR